jgi:hypothetical protein
MHLIIMDVQTSLSYRIIAIYRTFKPQYTSTHRENFRRQLNTENEAKTLF